MRITPKTSHSLQLNHHNEKLDKVVEGVLNQIFGQEATKIIYDYLEEKHSIQRHEVAQNLYTLSWALREFLGSGASVIEEVIQQNLRLRACGEDENTDFVERSKILKLA